MKRSVSIALVLVVTAVLMCSCAPANTLATSNGVGFWWGLLHGVIAPVAFIVSLFNETVGIYDVHNNGGWYDFGFLLGLSVWGGGGAGGAAATRCGRRR